MKQVWIPKTPSSSGRMFARILKYSYTDELSDELPFFAQVRPRRMIRL